jgi:hypothetical protein
LTTPIGLPWTDRAASQTSTGGTSLLDAPEQEHAVVGGEREHDRRGDDEVGRFHPAIGGEAEQPGQVAVLVDEDEGRQRPIAFC